MSTQWLSPDKLLIITTDNFPKTAGTSDVDDWHGHADLYSPTMNQTTRLTGLSKLITKPDISPLGPPHNFELSPNATRLHWQNFRHWGRLRYVPGTATMDGSQYREWEMELGSLNFWLDDRHYAEASVDSEGSLLQLNIHDAANGKFDRHFRPTSPQTKRILETFQKSRPSLETWVVANGTDYVLTVGKIETPYEPISDVVHKVKYPSGSEPIEQISLPASDAIIYHVRTTRRAKLLEMLHHIIPAIPGKPEVSEGLWVSHTDGTGMHQVGLVRGEATTCLEDVELVPGGKHLSFVYHGTLYVIAADSAKR